MSAARRTPTPQPAPDPEQLLGATEIAQEFGIPLSTWTSYATPRKRRDGTLRPAVGPPPDVTVTGARLWKRGTVVEWMQNRPTSGWRKGQTGDIRRTAEPAQTTPAKATAAVRRPRTSR